MDGKGIMTDVPGQGRNQKLMERENIEGRGRGREEAEGRGAGEPRGRGEWNWRDKGEGDVGGRGAPEMRGRGEVEYEVEYASPLTDESCIPLSPVEERFSHCPQLDEDNTGRKKKLNN